MKLTCLFLLVSLPCLTAAQKQPHIMFIMADDWGWGDVGWSEYPEIPTPRLMEMRQESLELTQFYSQPKCTAARAALMTARYPYRMGLQTDDVFNIKKANSLPAREKLLPAYLKDLGYTTHMVGKWHLGSCNKRVVPTAKGFDSFYGTWANTQDYFQHQAGYYYNWIWNTTVIRDVVGTYNTHLITSHTQYLLNNHFTHDATADKPLFIYVPYLAPHKPAQAPRRYIEDTACSLLDPTDSRRTYCGMVVAMDEGIGNITDTMKDLGVLDDFIIVVTSDNGASMKVGASSWPLRGNKQTVYEGGTRMRTLMRAPKFVNNRTGEYRGLVHMTDVLPTLYQAAGGDVKMLPRKMNGRSAWKAIQNGEATKRKWMVYNIDSSRKLGGLRWKTKTKDFKLVYQDAPRTTGWRRKPYAVLQSNAKQLPNRVGTKGVMYRLFNMATNPNEMEPSEQYPDAGEMFPKVLAKMKKKLQKLSSKEVMATKFDFIPEDDPAHPENNDGAWGVGGC